MHQLKLSWRPGLTLTEPPPGWEALGPVTPRAVVKHTAKPLDHEEEEGLHVAYVGGQGTNAEPFVVDVQPSPESGDDPWAVVCSALDSLTLPGAMFNYWIVAGTVPASSWKLVQNGAVGGTPAHHRLTGQEGPGGPQLVPPSPPVPGGAT